MLVLYSVRTCPSVLYWPYLVSVASIRSCIRTKLPIKIALLALAFPILRRALILFLADSYNFCIGVEYVGICLKFLYIIRCPVR